MPGMGCKQSHRSGGHRATERFVRAKSLVHNPCIPWVVLEHNPQKLHPPRASILEHSAKGTSTPCPLLTCFWRPLQNRSQNCDRSASQALSWAFQNGQQDPGPCCFTFSLVITLEGEPGVAGATCPILDAQIRSGRLGFRPHTQDGPLQTPPLTIVLRCFLLNSEHLQVREVGNGKASGEAHMDHDYHKLATEGNTKPDEFSEEIAEPAQCGILQPENHGAGRGHKPWMEKP
ncbi:hypothetical protein CB1_000160018 [Camelus ferus]|nr:hypothetical protein CB1_000160018 [Camelus ferus]